MGCSLGVGCDEGGRCYAEAMGEPKRCGQPWRDQLLDQITDPVARQAASLLSDDSLRSMLCTCEYPYPAEVWSGHHPNCEAG